MAEDCKAGPRPLVLKLVLIILLKVPGRPPAPRTQGKSISTTRRRQGPLCQPCASSKGRRSILHSRCRSATSKYRLSLRTMPFSHPSQAAHKMARFSPQSCLLRTVRLTRTAYAQSVGQKFYPPRIFGRWQEKEQSPEWKWKDLGMKIVNVVVLSTLYSTLIMTQACGFEMLYQEGRSREEIGFDGSSIAVSIRLVQVSRSSQKEFPGPSTKGRSATRSRIPQIHEQYSGSRLFSG